MSDQVERVIIGMGTAWCSKCEADIGQLIFETDDQAGGPYIVNAMELFATHDCPKADEPYVC